MDILFWMVQLVVGILLISIGIFTMPDNQGIIMIGVGNLIIGQIVHHGRLERMARKSS